jgi:LPXTG-motif cell wall-anchored protein
VLASVLTGALFTSAAVVGVALPAEAASGTASLTWGVKESFRSYILSPIAAGSISPTANNVTGTAPFVWSDGDSTVDPTAFTGEATFSGGIRFVGHAGALDMTLSNPRVQLSSASTGVLYVDTYSKSLASGQFETLNRMPIANLTLPAPTVTASAATWSNAAASLTPEGAALFGNYSAGTAMDPVSFTVPAAAPAQSTQTQLTAPVAGASAEENIAVALSATVTPAAAGTISFRNNGTEFAAAAVDAATGVASTSFAGLPVGSASLTAVFLPADPAAYEGSTSPATTYTVTPIPTPTAVDTKTTVSTPSPATRAILGAEVTLSATVAPVTGTGTPVGSVEFFTTVAGSTAKTSVGSSALTNGVATVKTSSLVAGGHGFSAVYRPATSAFKGSEGQWAVTGRTGTTPGNYGIVDPTTPAAYVPGASALSSSGANASWTFSAYSDATSGAGQWKKTADGANITVNGRAFAFSNGTVKADAGGAAISFTGWFQIEPHTGYWARLTNPTLAVKADGSGVWTADVTTSANPAPQRLVFASFTGAEVDQAGGEVDTDIALAYTDTTAPGTWAVDYSVTPAVAYGNAWTNAFILTLDPLIQAYFYQSTASAANLTKPPAPFSVEFDWAAQPAAAVVNSGSTVAQGQTLTVTGSGFRAGERVSALIQSDPVLLPSQVADPSGAVTFTWTVPTTFDATGHTITLSGEINGSVASPFTVTAVSAPAAPVDEIVQEVCTANAVSGATISWGVKQSFVSYINGPIAKGSVSGGWGSGSGAYNTEADKGLVNYSGSIHYTGHSGILDITLSNPSIQVNSANSATLYVTASGSGRIAMATLSLPDATQSSTSISWSNASASLTTAGSRLFSYQNNAFYPAGTALDPVSFAFPLGADVPCDSSTDAALAATGGDAPVDTLWIGIGMLLLGAGVFAVRRRRTTA